MNFAKTLEDVNEINSILFLSFCFKTKFSTRSWFSISFLVQISNFYANQPALSFLFLVMGFFLYKEEKNMNHGKTMRL